MKFRQGQIDWTDSLFLSTMFTTTTPHKRKAEYALGRAELKRQRAYHRSTNPGQYPPTDPQVKLRRKWQRFPYQVDCHHRICPNCKMALATRVHPCTSKLEPHDAYNIHPCYNSDPSKGPFWQPDRWHFNNEIPKDVKDAEDQTYYIPVDTRMWRDMEDTDPEPGETEESFYFAKDGEVRIAGLASPSLTSIFG
jgi:hypothetical protein